ncbi:hypothetical protein [Roseobacter sp. EG26]|uniref:hypothetical protein n=1 Tax=Roseobacter sp. EG26 TaxID=3412477 RepID=UPI003CE502EA
MSVVLAADSASTISYYENGALQQRYFKGANKVFQLSNTHPVGLMIFGNAEIMGVPWELAIKAFRKHLSNSSFDTVEGYAKAFQQFLNDNQQLFPDERRDENFAHAIELQSVICCKNFNEEADANQDFNEANCISELNDQVQNLHFENELDSEFLASLLETWPERILQNLRHEDSAVFHPHLKERSDARLKEIVSLAIILKAKQPPESPTGLVFAGFGDSSVYPEAYAVQKAGFIARDIVMAETEAIVIGQHLNSYISGFAQSSMADTFIMGFDAQAYETIQGVYDQSLPELLAPFIAEFGGGTEYTDSGVVLKNAEGDVLMDEEAFKQTTLEVIAPVGGSILQESRQKHGAPLERVISMLPVEEMAELAATMVDLQSLKEKVTRPSETVGGPVDVAIITKNEGLVWKKRKHFFDIDLNQRYLRRLHSND